MGEIEYGYCYCGCGQKTKISTQTNKKRNLIKGQPYKYIIWHHLKHTPHYCRDKNPLWKGGKIKANGYVKIYKPEHHKADNRGRIYEHTLICENALGKLLPDGAEIHHVNENRGDNSPGNIVLCQDSAYHSLLHQRARALKECGHANWLKCCFCKQYDDPKNMDVRKRSPNGKGHVLGEHRNCRNKYARNWKQNKRKSMDNLP